METRGHEIHIDHEKARAGKTNQLVRYVLLISLLLAIVALSAVWITGAATSNSHNNGVEDSQRAAAEQKAA